MNTERILWILACIALVALWYSKQPDKSPVGEWVTPPTDKRVDNLPKEKIKCESGVAVIPGAKDKLDLPPAVKQDPKKHVTASAIIYPDEHRVSVVSIFDEYTGDTTMQSQRMEHPWLAAENRGRAWIGYGYKTGGATAIRAAVSADVVQIRAVHIGGEATLDSDGVWFAGVGAAVRW
jgi:hypothetical protein